MSSDFSIYSKGKQLVKRGTKFFKKRLKQIVRLPFYIFNYIRINGKLKPPIFIVGCGHSGTTLLLKILGTHSNIHGISYESKLLMGREDIDTQVNEFNYQTIANGKRRWVEKTPKHINYIQKILDRWSQAKVIYLVRDGRDVAFSLTRRGHSLEDGMQRWIDDNYAGLPYLKNGRVLMVKYEDIVQSFKKEISKVLQFLGEEYEEEIESFYKSDNQVFTKTSKKSKAYLHTLRRRKQVQQPLFNGNGKWKSLPKEEIKKLEESGKSLLIKFGYIE